MKMDEIAGAGHASLRNYLFGLSFAIVLTVIPFVLVLTHAASPAVVIPVILVLAVIQIVVHLVFFLHMNRSSDQQWNRLAFAYTVIVFSILVGASIWIMYHLNYNMMIGR